MSDATAWLIAAPAMPILVPAVRGWISRLPVLCRKSVAVIDSVLALSVILLLDAVTALPAFWPMLLKVLNQISEPLG